MTLREELSNVVVFLCEDEGDARRLQEAFSISLNPSFLVSEIQQAYQTVAYWYVIAGNYRRASEDEQEDEYRDAERILGAAERGLDKAMIAASVTLKHGG